MSYSEFSMSVTNKKNIAEIEIISKLNETVSKAIHPLGVFSTGVLIIMNPINNIIIDITIIR